MPIDYRILRSRVQEHLENRVIQLSKFGFTCVGGVDTSMDGWHGKERCVMFSQAMSRECENPPTRYAAPAFDPPDLEELETLYGKPA